jgi:hypothetical protein
MMPASPSLPGMASAAAESSKTSFGKASTWSGPTGPTVDYWLDVAYDDHPYEMSWLLQSLTTGAGVAESGFYEVTKLGYLLSQPVRFVPGDELQRVIIPSVTICAVATEKGPLYSTQLCRF